MRQSPSQPLLNSQHTRRRQHTLCIRPINRSSSFIVLSFGFIVLCSKSTDTLAISLQCPDIVMMSVVCLSVVCTASVL